MSWGTFQAAWWWLLGKHLQQADLVQRRRWQANMTLCPRGPLTPVSSGSPSHPAGTHKPGRIKTSYGKKVLTWNRFQSRSLQEGQKKYCWFSQKESPIRLPWQFTAPAGREAVCISLLKSPSPSQMEGFQFMDQCTWPCRSGRYFLHPRGHHACNKVCYRCWPYFPPWAFPRQSFCLLEPRWSLPRSLHTCYPTPARGNSAPPSNLHLQSAALQPHLAWKHLVVFSFVSSLHPLAEKVFSAL